MKKKLLMIGVAVLIFAILPAAALNLMRNRGENNQQDSEIIREDDQDVVGANPGDSTNERDEEPMEPDLDGESGGNDDEEEIEAPKEKDSSDTSDEKKQGSSDSDENKSSESSTNPEAKDEEENSKGNESDEDEKIVWGDLGFSKTLDVFLQDTEGKITRSSLAKLSVLFYEQLSGNKAVAAWDETFEDTKNAWVLKAYNLKIIPEMENRKFDPDRRITRQEGAYTFYRILRALDRPYPNGDFNLKGADADSIGNWAYEAMGFMDYYEILPRRDSNRLDPDKEITAGEIKALWNNTRKWIDSYDQYSNSLQAPTGLFVEEDQGSAKIGWDPVEDADYYHVYEGLSKDGPFHAFNDETGRPLKVYWDQEYSLQVTGLREGQTYYYRVRSVVEGIRSSQSEIVKITATNSPNMDFEDYREYLMKDHRRFKVGDAVVEFENIEITRSSEEGQLSLRYYLDKENSKKLRGLIRNGQREDIRTLYGYIIREMSEFYEKDIEAYIVYEDFGLKEYPKQYQDNRIEPDPIGQDTNGTYFLWFPYLEMIRNYEQGSFTHRWFYRNEDA